MIQEVLEDRKAESETVPSEAISAESEYQWQLKDFHTCCSLCSTKQLDLENAFPLQIAFQKVSASHGN